MLLGIDEAGRGPVIGPMVFGAAFWKISDDTEISTFGFNGTFKFQYINILPILCIDSKQLSAEKRNNLFSLITEKKNSIIGYDFESVTAEAISNLMLQEIPTSLNEISYQATITLIKRVLENLQMQVSDLFVDAVGNCDSYKKRLEKEFPAIKNITVVPKADSLFKVVGAASIIAKVTRDRYIKNKKFHCSGYPADVETVKWLQDNFDPVFGYTRDVRFSWKTVKRLLLEDEDGNNGTNISKFSRSHGFNINDDGSDIANETTVEIKTSGVTVNWKHTESILGFFKKCESVRHAREQEKSRFFRKRKFFLPSLR